MTATVRAVFRGFRNWAPVLRRRGRGSLVDATVWKRKPIESDAVTPVTAPESRDVDRDLAPILGEFAWHSLTADARLLQVSEDHYRLVAGLLNDAGAQSVSKARVLEIAAYAHITGYMLRGRLGARADLLDISPSTLRLGAPAGARAGIGDRWHDSALPATFTSCPTKTISSTSFYICSALHHTWRWQRVVSEMLRVLAPGGILFLENEPCRRHFCHYRFRANRPERFGDLERALDRLGILRTVAEPFPSTRPETLFGMVENQSIPIASLCAALAAKCAPLAITVNPEICMGPLEHELIDRIGEGADTCARWLTSELAGRVEQANRAITEADKGMGFSLPTPDEIAKLCGSTVRALIELPADRGSADFRIGMAEIFGASVQMTLRKKGARRVLPGARLRRDLPDARRESSAHFRPMLRVFSTRAVRCSPTSNRARFRSSKTLFRRAIGIIRISPDGLRDLSPATARPSFTIPVLRSGPLLVVVRLYVAVEGSPFRIALWDESGELAGFDAYRADSLLLSPVVQCAADASLLRLSIRTSGLGAAAGQELTGMFTLSYAGAFPL